jgi:hypothetical protein
MSWEMLSDNVRDWIKSYYLLFACLGGLDGIVRTLHKGLLTRFGDHGRLFLTIHLALAYTSSTRVAGRL